jgi:hypothetical protein
MYTIRISLPDVLMGYSSVQCEASFCFGTYIHVSCWGFTEIVGPPQGALGALKPDSTREFLLRTAVLGWVASVPFMLLIFTGCLMEVMMSSPVEGSISKGQMIGSVIEDVGVVGTNAISCFVVIPALALRNWRGDQSDRKAELNV